MLQRQEIENLKTKLNEKNDLINKLEAKIEQLKKISEEMRFNYLKDINHLKEFMFIKDKEQ